MSAFLRALSHFLMLQKHGYQLEGLRKIEVARRIAQQMDPDRNRSKSFQVFRDALRKVVG